MVDVMIMLAVAVAVLAVAVAVTLRPGAYRRYAGRRVLVRCADVTYRGTLAGAHRRTLILEQVTAHDRDSTQPIDGRLLVELDQVLHVQVPTA